MKPSVAADLAPARNGCPIPPRNHRQATIPAFHRPHRGIRGTLSSPGGEDGEPGSDMTDSTISDEAMEEQKDLRVRLPVKQHLELHKLKILTDQNMSEIVRAALEEYVDVESIDLNEVVRGYLDERVPDLPSPFEVETDLREPRRALVDPSGVHAFLDTFLDEVEATWEADDTDGDPRILVGTGTGAGDDEAILTLELRDIDLPEGVCRRHFGFPEGASEGEPVEESTMARVVANVQGGTVGCGYREDGVPRFTARFPTPD